MQERLHDGFWHGRLVNKGVDEDDAIREAIVRVLEYGDLGIHIRDHKDKLRPMLTPREEDLLRRCILRQGNCIGVDLEWWGVGPNFFSGGEASQVGWTKVLMGHFLMDHNLGPSRPTFFKFEPSGNAAYVHRDAAILHQKLSHVKVCASLRSGTRCLLATQKVGELSDHPIPLGAFLRGAPERTLHAIPQVVADVAAQLKLLGSPAHDQVPVSSLLWPFHARERIAAVWEEHRSCVEAEALGPEAGPAHLNLRESTEGTQHIGFV